MRVMVVIAIKFIAKLISYEATHIERDFYSLSDSNSLLNTYSSALHTINRICVLRGDRYEFVAIDGIVFC